MRRWFVLFAAASVSGCSLFGPGSVSGPAVADQVRPFFRTAAGADPTNLTCAGVDAAVGAKSACTATDASGQTWPITAVIRAVDGDNITYDPRFDDLLADNAAAQGNIATQLKTKTGRDFPSVECTGLQKRAVGATRTCTAIETGGGKWPVEHRLTNLDGGGTVTFKDALLYAKTVESIVTTLSHNLSTHYGLARGMFPPGSAVCSSMLRATAGETIHCTAYLADHSDTAVTVKTTKVEGDKIYFQLFPDNAPDLSMSGWQLSDPR